MPVAVLTTALSSEYAALLLHWMTHKQEGSAGQLKTGIRSLLHTYSSETQNKFERGIRKRLQWLGYAHFEQNVAETWHIMPPGLLILPESSETNGTEKATPSTKRCAVLIGARTPDFENAVGNVARQNAVSCEKTSLSYAPPRFALKGRYESLAKVAYTMGFLLIENAAMNRLCHVRPISCLWDETVLRNRPEYGCWQAADLDTLAWRTGINLRADNYSQVDLLGPYPAALIAQPEHGPWQYFAAAASSQFFAVPDAGSALLAAAWASGKTVCGYDADSALFVSPKDLPMEMARVLCLCSGKTSRPLSEEEAKRFPYPNVRGYENVPPSVATALLAAVSPPEVKPKQSPPETGVFWLQHSAF